MVSNKKIIDILFVEESDQVTFLFNEVSKIFNLTIKIAKNLDEFIELATIYDFKFVLCNLHVEYNFAGLFLSRIYSSIRKVKTNDGKLFFYSFQNNPKLELAKLSLDDFSEEKFFNFYDFLMEYFQTNYLHYFSSETFKQSLTA